MSQKKKLAIMKNILALEKSKLQSKQSPIWTKKIVKLVVYQSVVQVSALQLFATISASWRSWL